jgi:hypothetical protein
MSNSVALGSVLYGSWGYDQTNVEFYEVVKVSASGKSVGIRERKQRQVSPPDNSMTGVFLPDPIGYASDEVLSRRVDADGSVRLNDYCRMREWDGQPKHASWYA